MKKGLPSARSTTSCLSDAIRPPPDRPGCKCVIDAAVFELLARGPEDFAEQIEMVTIEELQQYKNVEEDDVSRK
jgi:hypothetical protein